VLEISVNMSGSGFPVEQFKERAGYLIDTLAKSHPAAPIVCISLFPLGTGDLWTANKPRTQAFRDALAELVTACPNANVHFVSGPDLLSFTGLRATIAAKPRQSIVLHWFVCVEVPIMTLSGLIMDQNQYRKKLRVRTQPKLYRLNCCVSRIACGVGRRWSSRLHRQSLR